jgi:hypothetical protein
MCSWWHDEFLLGGFWVLGVTLCFCCVGVMVCLYASVHSVSSLVIQCNSMSCVSFVVWVLCSAWCSQQCGCDEFCKILSPLYIRCFGYLKGGYYVSPYAVILSMGFYYVSIK